MTDKTYALITGASEGFGKSLALECARRNMNVILVALPHTGLAQLACYIERNFNIHAFYFEHDLTNKCEYVKLLAEVKEKGLSVSILINNAGMGGTHLFEERDAEYYYRQIELNVLAPTLITHLFLKDLEKNSPAYILNVSSLASFFYLPKKQVYGGTKSYLVSFSKSLRRELKQKNIAVSTICPGGMNTTPMLTLQNRSLKGFGRWSVMNPEEVTRIAINGMLRNKEVIIPGIWNKLFMLLDKLMPKWIKEKITKSQMHKNKVFSNPVKPFFTSLKNAI